MLLIPHSLVQPHRSYTVLVRLVLPALYLVSTNTTQVCLLIPKTVIELLLLLVLYWSSPEAQGYN